MLETKAVTNGPLAMQLQRVCEMRLLVGLRSFTDCRRPVAVQVCSVQAGRLPSV